MIVVWSVGGVATAGFAAAACAALIVVLRPALRRYALVKPNTRSSHREPTPQGGGGAVVAATIAASWLGMLGLGVPLTGSLAVVLAAVVAMACVGAADDVRSLAVLPRLLLQAAAVAAVIYALPEQLRVLSMLPWWLERALLVVGGLWFVNLVNFMDGIDLMTVAEVVPIAAALAMLGALGALPGDGIIVALALGGATLGFAYFNRPPAKLFLGDVGSLPIGLVLGWLLVLLAGRGELAAAILLPMYYLADATLTLIRRLWNGERPWQAHRAHCYQHAVDRGFTVTAVVARVVAINIGLAILAVTTAILRNRLVDIAALVVGAALVAWLLNAFWRGRPPIATITALS